MSRVKINGRCLRPAVVGLLIMISPGLAFNSFADDSWHYAADVYLWAPGAGGETATGDDLDIDFTDLAKDLELGFMGTFAADKNRWILEVDLIYLDVEHDKGIDVAPVVDLKTVELSGWISTAFVGYRVLEQGETYLAVLGGVRYLDFQLDFDVRSRPPLPPERLDFSYSEDFFDGVVGVIGRFQLSERWAIPYYLDVGAGDTDTTWQIYAGISYAFESFELLAGYRYLEWDFDDDNEAFNDLNLGGPMVGARFRF